ncbi:uncharacterized protein IL334_003757 [Kwoniella shivajii]|uniref:Major facilitator superfamily (MFS) profile domain-containing protein n=1 Tax=Kwoniella shivajii TaxID=564305 RepID=A0ABZ1CZP0_9TREE|nr:hypothetical protein IL334_003757 [Kwoniella shivajii]
MTQTESRWQHSRAYTLAIAAFMGIFMFGYDTGLGGGLIVLPSFLRDFDMLDLDKKALADRKGNVVSILQGGCLAGALLAAPLTNRIGRQKCLIVNCFAFLLGASIMTASPGNLGMFYGGRFTVGLGVGAMSMVCPTYVSELSPKHIRGRITGLFQVVVVIGVAASYWITYGVQHMAPTSMQWRIPVGFQLVPVGLMLCVLPFMKESPRWLATHHQNELALKNLAWIRKTSIDDVFTRAEFNEIIASVAEEEAVTGGRSYKEAFVPGNRIRFFIAFAMFTFQQWSGQNSINYYAPDIFISIGIKGASTSLLASGIYGIVKIVATAVFIFFGIERFGRRWSLTVGLALMSLFLWIIGAIFNTNPPNVNATSPSGASIGMAACIYLFVIPYCFSVGPVPWVYCAEIFNNRTRSYGLMTASATQWLWNLIVSRFTPNIVLSLKHGGIFFFFASINIFAATAAFFLPETKGLALEDMDVLFGLVTAEQRQADLARVEAGLSEKEQELMNDDKMSETRIERV